ncbi:hypothetical protein Agub_g7777 [Astrephomene gubernaculifera]|uniref:Protein kinase domain-containing protein n=1 Tax=Astrephomene gubernaculifera TaxID=47775 RepID=A0AAD3DSJ8_9CHLO|nr:hypothetical protein Agub_g7777 [Astrephomene gubernaculifera]
MHLRLLRGDADPCVHVNQLHANLYSDTAHDDGTNLRRILLLLTGWAVLTLMPATAVRLPLGSGVTVYDLLATSGVLPQGVLSLQPQPNAASPTTTYLPSTTLTLQGWGSHLPGNQISGAYNQPGFTIGSQHPAGPPISPPSIPSTAPSSPTSPSSPTPPNPPSFPNFPPTDPDKPFTILDCSGLVDFSVSKVSVISLKPGQHLKLSSLSVLLIDLVEPLGPAASMVIDHLTPSGLVQVPKGAILTLQNVTLVLSPYSMRTYLEILSCKVSAWPYSTAVTILYNEIHIESLTTWSLASDGGRDNVNTAGGEVQWLGVTLRGADAKPFINPLGATAVTEAWQLGYKLQTDLVGVIGIPGSLFLSLAADIVIPRDGSWEQAFLVDGRPWVLLGDPERSTTLDLSGLEGAWYTASYQNNWASNLTAENTLMHIHGLTLINLPHTQQPRAPSSLLAISLQSFGIYRGSTGGYDSPQLVLKRCTIVVPDQEVAFLERAVLLGRNNGTMPAVGDPSKLFAVFDVQVPSDDMSASSPSSTGGKLLVTRLRIGNQVSLINCTLLSASRYTALPDSRPLLPSERVWPPEVLHGNVDTAAQWGPLGTAFAQGLQDALANLNSTCGPLPGKAPLMFTTIRNDGSIPSLAATTAFEEAKRIHISSGGRLASASECIVGGFPQQLGGDRTFVNMKGAIGRVELQRPITLRNLVLYNLAPGGMYPLVSNGNLGYGSSYGYSFGIVGRQQASAPAQAAPQLEGADAAWTNSSLPLWFFRMAREPAGVTSDTQQQPLLVLENVTLVIPEVEWRAMVAAVLLVLRAAATPPPPSGVLAAASEGQQPALVQALDREVLDTTTSLSSQQQLEEQPDQRYLLGTKKTVEMQRPGRPLLRGNAAAAFGKGGSQAGVDTHKKAARRALQFLGFDFGFGLPWSNPPPPPAQAFVPQPPKSEASGPAAASGPANTIATVVQPPASAKPPPAGYHVIYFPKAPPSPPKPPPVPPSRQLPRPPPLLPSPSPMPPLPPAPPPSTPSESTTRAALLEFASSSQVLSYNYDAGELVLAVARHYGWVGTNVTLTYKLPADAPSSASFLSYPPLVLPYQDLAGMDINITVEQPGVAGPPSIAPTIQPVHGSSPGDSNDGDSSVPTAADGILPVWQYPSSVVAPSQQYSSHAPSPYYPHVDGTPPATPSVPPSNSSSSVSRPAWVPPVAGCLSAFGAVLMLPLLLLAAYMTCKMRRCAAAAVTAPVKEGCPSAANDAADAVSSMFATCAASTSSALPAVKTFDDAEGKAQQLAVGSGVSGSTSGAFGNNSGIPHDDRGGAGGSSGTGGESRAGIGVEDRRYDRTAGGGPEMTSTSTAAQAAPWNGGSPVEKRKTSSAAVGNVEALGGAICFLEANRLAVHRVLKAALMETTALGKDPQQQEVRGSQRQQPGQKAINTFNGKCGASSLEGKEEDSGTCGLLQGVEALPDLRDEASSLACSADALKEMLTYYRSQQDKAEHSPGEDQPQHQQREQGDVELGCSAPQVPSEAHMSQAVPIQQDGERKQQPGPLPTLRDAIAAIRAELRDPQFRVHSVLSRGTTSVVFRGAWKDLPVAIKTLVVLGGTLGQEGLQKHRAVLEAAISVSLAHPNIVATYVYDMKPLVGKPPQRDQQDLSAARNTTPGLGAAANPDGCPSVAVSPLPGNQEEGVVDAYKLYIVQEFCNAGTLRQALDDGVAGSVRAGGLLRVLALRLALDVAQGMRHIHGCRIVHGDLKSDNVLLVSGPRATSIDGSTALETASGAGLENAGAAKLQLTAKVADFGLSLPLPEGATHASQRFQGTPAYMAPEVMLGGHLSPRADVWSFGLLLLELYYGCTVADMLVISTSGEAAEAPGQSNALDELRPFLPFLFQDMVTAGHVPFAELVTACLASDPRVRPGFGDIVVKMEWLLNAVES